MELKIKCVNTTTSSDGSQYGKFVIEPLEKGFGTTIGNSLRRVLLSSLEGTAVTSTRIEGITRKQSRQIINHGHVLVNDKKVDIPSFLVKPGDVITIKSKSTAFLKSVTEMIDMPCSSAWMTIDKEALKITFDRIPEREELDPDFKEQLVIEYYSK